MVAGLDAHAWFGLLVYFAVMAIVLYPLRIKVPDALAQVILAFLVVTRLRDSPTPSYTDPPDDEISPSPSNGPSDGDIELKPVEDTPRGASEDSAPTKASIEVPRDTSASAPHAQIGLGVEQNSQGREMYLVLDLRTAPVIGLLLLLASRSINVDVLRLGIVGEGGVRPFDVLVLFISLAYISTALDATGALRSLAFFIAQKSAQVPKPRTSLADKVVSGRRLYLNLFMFWFVTGAFVGNDPIVLSGTAFLAYFTRVCGITVPTAWITSQFYAANIASAILVSSNPTNVLIAGAFNLNFLTGYTSWTILPSVITALVTLPLTYFTFNYLIPPSRDPAEPFRPSQAYIPLEIHPPDVDPRSALLDPIGAYFHSILMAVTLVLLVGTSFVSGGKVEVWMVTAPAGLLALLRDLSNDWYVRRKISTSTAPSTSSQSPRSTKISLPSFLRLFTSHFPTTSSTISHLPLSLLPFAGGIFVLARSLTTLGWTSIFASWLAKICTSPAITVFFLGYFIAVVMCPLCGTNIGATILMVEIMTDPNFMGAVHVRANPLILKGAIFSTAVSSNLGAMSWGFSSSLAGLLWVSILKQKGIAVRQKDFATWNFIFLPLLSTVASSIIVLQCYYF